MLILGSGIAVLIFTSGAVIDPFIGTLLAKTLEQFRSINILQSDERIKLKTGGQSCQWRKSHLQNGGSFGCKQLKTRQ